MVAILLADTDPKIKNIIHRVERMCHDANVSIIIHRQGEDLTEVLESLGLGKTKVLAFSPEGRLTLAQAVERYGQNVLLVIGGFPEGDFKSDVYRYSDDTVSLGPKLLEIPTVIDTVIRAYRQHGQCTSRKEV